MQHTDITVESWSKLSLETQMANIGSEIFRALKWKNKNNPGYAQAANERALELFDFTLSARKTYPQLKEIARARELWLDFFVGDNQYHQTAQLWENYFYAFTFSAQRNK